MLATKTITIAAALAALVWQAAVCADDSMPTLAPVVVSAPEPEIPELTQIQPDARRPQSMVDRETIEQVASPFADFGSLANLTPSFLSSAPNGIGFDAAKNMTLRGFPDGQFNVTLDGIPFQDPDGFSHHSTSFFPASSIDHIVVDRSPGSGTTLGYATIGGSIDITSLKVPDSAGLHAYGSYGSFGTSLAGARLSNGQPTGDGQTGVVLNAQHLETDGAQSYGQGNRDDLLFKSESRLAGGAQFTLLYDYDRYHFNNPPSVSTQQIAEFGPNFGYNAIAGTPTYYGYSDTDRHSDFGYARLRLNLNGGFTLSETAYTYSYSTQGLSLKGDSTASPVGSGYGVPPTDIAGRSTETSYRTTGNIAQFEHTDDIGVFKGGLWLEHADQKNTRNAVDLTTGASYNINKTANSPYLFDYWGTLDTVQPYVEYKWQATHDLTIQPGLRYQYVRRGFDAPVVPNSLPSTNGDIHRSVSSVLPSVEGNYAFTRDFHLYVQWAEGALVPNQSFFYTANPTQGNQAQPQTSQAIQGGVIYTGPCASATLDAYWVDLK
ncbi:MAG TPA: TonB-dependent receptor, partial [Candidatus Acidoferrum sp.]|nr:TonB-dependent receptor [Candidatus Acidoferrum sp.]